MSKQDNFDWTQSNYVSKRPVASTRFYQCGRKDLYTSEEEAEAAAVKIYQIRQIPLVWYRCPHCGRSGYHLKKYKGDKRGWNLWRAKRREKRNGNI